MLINITNPITDWIFPRRCFVCKLDILHGSICDSCLSMCNPCPNVAAAGAQAKHALFFYELAMKQMLREGKYNRKPHMVYLLFELIEKELSKSGLLNELRDFAPEVVTFIPTHIVNRIVRGADLPWLFASVVAKRLSVAVKPMLLRKRYFSRQVLHQRKGDRRKLIFGSYVLKSSMIQYERVLLVDDVVTTGATLDAATSVLRECCKNILTVAIARTP